VAGHAVTWLDVFTPVALAGNGLCVVHDADDLDEATMLAIARETRLSETTFLQTATADGADYRTRIFALQGELPFAGHPSLGTAVAVARARGEREARYVQQTHAGLQPIEVKLDGAHARATMRQGQIETGSEYDAAQVLAAIGLEAADAHPEWAPQVISTGVPHLMAPVRDVAALRRAAGHPALLPALLSDADAVVVYVVAIDVAAGEARARGFFLGDVGLLEDPATGSAAGPLLAYVARRTGLQALTIRQGEELARPSLLETRMDGDGVLVGGDVVVLAEGRSLL
jgi:trans-2,3-dihydro-3-hydroxyanthranilate isomerase